MLQGHWLREEKQHGSNILAGDTVKEHKFGAWKEGRYYWHHAEPRLVCSHATHAVPMRRDPLTGRVILGRKATNAELAQHAVSSHLLSKTRKLERARMYNEMWI